MKGHVITKSVVRRLVHFLFYVASPETLFNSFCEQNYTLSLRTNALGRPKYTAACDYQIARARRLKLGTKEYILEVPKPWFFLEVCNLPEKIKQTTYKYENYSKK